MSALIIYNIHLIFALDDSIMANIDRLNQFFSDEFRFKSKLRLCKRIHTNYFNLNNSLLF